MWYLLFDYTSSSLFLFQFFSFLRHFLISLHILCFEILPFFHFSVHLIFYFCFLKYLCVCVCVCVQPQGFQRFLVFDFQFKIILSFLCFSHFLSWIYFINSDYFCQCFFKSFLFSYPSITFNICFSRSFIFSLILNISTSLRSLFSKSSLTPAFISSNSFCNLFKVSKISLLI